MRAGTADGRDESARRRADYERPSHDRSHHERRDTDPPRGGSRYPRAHHDRADEYDHHGQRENHGGSDRGGPTYQIRDSDRSRQAPRTDDHCIDDIRDGGRHRGRDRDRSHHRYSSHPRDTSSQAEDRRRSEPRRDCRGQLSGGRDRDDHRRKRDAHTRDRTGRDDQSDSGRRGVIAEAQHTDREHADRSGINATSTHRHDQSGKTKLARDDASPASRSSQSSGRHVVEDDDEDDRRWDRKRMERPVSPADTSVPRATPRPRTDTEELWSIGKQREKETDVHRLCQRQKQIDKGKNTVAYDRYRQAIPMFKRERGLDRHPGSPDVTQKCSKRSFDGQIRKWRRALHLWDEAPEVGGDGATTSLVSSGELTSAFVDDTVTKPNAPPAESENISRKDALPEDTTYVHIPDGRSTGRVLDDIDDDDDDDGIGDLLDGI